MMFPFKIGQRVRFKGNKVIGPCEGIVIKIWPPDDFDEPDYPGQITMRPDVLPQPWPYINYDIFAPWIDQVEAL